MNKIMLIRHAEKPEPGIHGVDLRGRRSSKDLTPRGWQRAGALNRLFDSNRRSPAGILPAPTAIFASAVEPGAKSRRPRHTVRPLSELLGIGIDHRFGEDEEPELVHRVLAVTGPALVCWHHEGIPKLVTLLAPELDRPPVWPEDRFDLVWVLDRDDGGRWRFSQVAQLLLSGDSATAIV